MPKRYNTPHRSHVVKTRLTDEEYADFTERLAPYGISQSEFLRQAIRRTTIWLLSICGTITHSIHQIASWKYRKKLQKCSKSLIVKRLPTGCVHTATKPTIPLIGMTGWSMKLSLLPYLPMNCMSGK